MLISFAQAQALVFSICLLAKAGSCKPKFSRRIPRLDGDWTAIGRVSPGEPLPIRAMLLFQVDIHVDIHFDFLHEESPQTFWLEVVSLRPPPKGDWRICFCGLSTLWGPTVPGQVPSSRLAACIYGIRLYPQIWLDIIRLTYPYNSWFIFRDASNLGSTREEGA